MNPWLRTFIILSQLPLFFAITACGASSSGSSESDHEESDASGGTTSTGGSGSGGSDSPGFGGAGDESPCARLELTGNGCGYRTVDGTATIAAPDGEGGYRWTFAPDDSVQADLVACTVEKGFPADWVATQMEKTQPYDACHPDLEEGSSYPARFGFGVFGTCTPTFLDIPEVCPKP